MSTVSWRQKIRNASFRGVPFYVEGHQLTGGRRTSLLEFPGRDRPATQDHGRRGRIYNVRAFVIGDDYLSSRDRLLKALEDKGPGELVHPFYGTLQATVPDFRASGETNENGMEKVLITFEEAGGEIYYDLSPASPVSKASTLKDRAEDTARLAKDRFRQVYDVLELPAKKLQQVRDMVDQSFQVIRDASQVIVGAAVATTELAYQIKLLEDDIKRNFESPIKALAILGEAFSYLRETLVGADKKTLIKALAPAIKALAASNVPDPTSGDEDDRRTIASIEGLRDVQTVLLLSELTQNFADLVEDAPRGVLQSEMDAYVEELIESTDTIIAVVEDVEILVALFDMLPAVEELRELASFPTLRIIEAEEPTDAISLTYQVYGSLDHLEEVIERNRPKNPAMLTGTLEVLGD